ncbi:MFS general substrate transporter [Aspergillus homomorphus CBS 101889]|uniref:MFS general substrate transporter n=1 Tax=Aspergillus homomorphus (strain CBS 101889) TaxID=1450537 RepID=A0A395ICR6_ASPHC|nr:MFS general substrate transporter [Aspergillus homomorphus CBS 101889]RAL16908.1 MFS general substrate transporter [Aspergillus homomorphus CBS 101889]
MVGQLIAGRTIQGLGSGGILILVDLVVFDLVPQRERGKYLGIVLSLATVGAVLGPVLGGVLAQANWRWVFYLKIPLTGPVLLSMLIFLQLNDYMRLYGALTGLVGLVLAFNAALLMQWTLYILPVNFQGVQHKSPLTSGIDLLPYSAFLS